LWTGRNSEQMKESRCMLRENSEEHWSQNEKLERLVGFFRRSADGEGDFGLVVAHEFVMFLFPSLRDLPQGKLRRLRTWIDESVRCPTKQQVWLNGVQLNAFVRLCDSIGSETNTSWPGPDKWVYGMPECDSTKRLRSVFAPYYEKNPNKCTRLLARSLGRCRCKGVIDWLTYLRSYYSDDRQLTELLQKYINQ